MVSNDSAPIAVIVMSYGPRASLVAAVRSLLDQGAPADIVVVHSSGGDCARLLADADLHVRLVQSKTRLLPGGARNAGIAATRAPIVAFLADDCVAESGWIAERLKAHAEGAAAVSSALVCHRPRNPVAVAAHLSLYVRRLPGADPALALRYGASYARHLFESHGGFRDDLEGGEDTDFHQRLTADERPIWRPQVRTVHNGPETIGAFCVSQFRRGRRMAAAWASLGGHNRAQVAADAVRRTARIVAEGFRFSQPSERAVVVLAVPLIALGNLAYAWGAWTWSGARDQRSSEA